MEDKATKSDKGVWLCQTISTAEIIKASKGWPTEEGGDEWLRLEIRKIKYEQKSALGKRLSRLLGYLE